MNDANPKQNVIVNEPDLTDVFQFQKKDIFINLNCHHVGVIQSFNADEQTAVVKVAYQRTYYAPNQQKGTIESSLVEYPLLVDCPVVFPGGVDGCLTFPVLVGASCLVLFNDRDMDRWFNGQNNMAPNTLRLHSISDGFALVGIRSIVQSLANVETDRVSLRYGSARVSATNDSLVAIKNQNEDLKDILQDLMTAINAITVITPGAGTSGNPVNSASFTAISNRIGDLLK